MSICFAKFKCCTLKFCALMKVIFNIAVLYSLLHRRIFRRLVLQISLQCYFLLLPLAYLYVNWFFPKQCTGYETMLNICRASENKHYSVYILKSQRKQNASWKFLGITIPAALETKKLKMLAAAAEKKVNGKKRKAQKKSCYPFYSSLIQRYLHKQFIFK